MLENAAKAAQPFEPPILPDRTRNCACVIIFIGLLEGATDADAPDCPAATDTEEPIESPMLKDAPEMMADEITIETVFKNPSLRPSRTQLGN